MSTPVIEKIGVFDSGLGGLTVLKQLLRSHPQRSYIYFGDTAHVPYGNRDAEDVIALVSEISRYLVQEGCQALIVACNTSSALAMTALRTSVDVPIIGVIDPGASEAAGLTKVGRIAVLSTPLTAKSGVYAERIQVAAERMGERVYPEVFEIGCPELVPIVEGGDLHSPETQRVLSGYVDQLFELGVDTVIMGCTHYPILLPILAPLLEDKIQIVDPAMLIPRVLDTWETHPVLPPRGEVIYQVSGEPLAFEERAERFLGQPVHAQRVCLRSPETTRSQLV